MHIVHVTPEIAPFAKAGGLGDVAAALPAAQAALGHRVRVIVPGYRDLLARLKGMAETGPRLPAAYRVGGTDVAGEGRLFSHRGCELIALTQREFFDRDGIYGGARGSFPDNGLRFGWFAGAALTALRAAGEPVDAIFCHDWPAALAPVYLRLHPVPDDPLGEPASILVIHNLAHQGLFPGTLARQLALPSLVHPPGEERGGTLGMLAAGIRFATFVVTVSPTYAREIVTPQAGRGLDALLRARGDDLAGILNGLDTETWDPATDTAIAAPYDASDLAGKERCKEALQREAGLVTSASLPLFGLVSRADPQKGIDLVAAIAPWLVSEGAQLVALSTGDPRQLHGLRELARAAPQSVALSETFDEPLAHRIYAGADFFLMPSRFEPCGLGQLIALRYGTLPVAHRTGGLADTVRDLDEDPARGNGFLFDVPDAEGLRWAAVRALELFRGDAERLATARRRAMQADLSWERSARDYDRVIRLAVRRERARILR